MIPKEEFHSNDDLPLHTRLFKYYQVARRLSYIVRKVLIGFNTSICSPQVVLIQTRGVGRDLQSSSSEL